MSTKNREPEIFEMFETLRVRHPWFDRVLDGVSNLLSHKDEDVEKLTKERDEWKALATWRENAHTEGYREGKALADLRIRALEDENLALRRAAPKPQAEVVGNKCTICGAELPE